MYSIKENSDTQSILNNLSQLRLYTEEENLFWDYFLQNVLALTKTKFVFVLTLENATWQLEYEKSNLIILDELKKNILKIGTSLITRAIDNTFAYEKLNDSTNALVNHSIVAIALKREEIQKSRVMLLVVPNANKSEFSNTIVRLSLVNDIAQHYYSLKSIKKSSDVVLKTQVDTSSLASVLEILNTILYEKNFSLAGRKIVDEFTNRYNCSKVTFGWANDFYVKPIAISHIENFQKDSHSINTLEALFEESYDQDEEIFYPDDKEGVLITVSHQKYVFENNLKYLYTFPIRLEDEKIGIISFEKTDTPLSVEEIETIRLSLNYIAPQLNDIYLKDRNIFLKIKHTLKNSTKSFLGPEKSLQKIAILLISMVLLVIIFGKLMYKVEGVTSIKTDDILYLSSPYDGIIKQVNIDTGDDVKKNDILVEFDTEELSFKRLEISSDIVKYTREGEKARASRSLAEMKIALAKKEQAVSSLKRVEYYLSQSKIFAPFNGIIVEGEREKLNGAPFSKGDIIIQIANSTHLYAKLKISEENIDEIKVGQRVEINLLSRPEEHFIARVEKIIPIANVDDVNGNVFTINVVFQEKAKEWMRPGMSGLAKIEIEKRSILWILTHKLSDYFRMYFWY